MKEKEHSLALFLQTSSDFVNFAIPKYSVAIIDRVILILKCKSTSKGRGWVLVLNIFEEPYANEMFSSRIYFC